MQAFNREEYYSAGKVKSKWHAIQLPDGHWVRHGKFESFFENGVTQIIAEYEFGVPSGMWREWWPEGHLKEHGRFSKGKRVGVWIHYSHEAHEEVELGLHTHTGDTRLCLRFKKPCQMAQVIGTGIQGDGWNAINIVWPDDGEEPVVEYNTVGGD